MSYDDGAPELDREKERRFRGMLRQLDSERKAASLIVELMLADTPRHQWASIASHPDLQNYGALVYISSLFERKLTKEPDYARSLAELGMRIVEALPPNPPYPKLLAAQMKAHAAKDYGKYLRFIGRQKEAEEIFREAVRMLGGQATLLHDAAVIRLALALTLQELEQFDESLALLAECKSVFRNHGDARNMSIAAFVEGVLLHRMKQFREAREAYLLIVATTPDLDDEQLGALNLSIGLCSIELGDYGAAQDAFAYAETLFSELDQPMNVLNVELARGRLLIRFGQLTAGVNLLRPVRRQFLSHGLREEAGLAGLAIVEGLLGLERHSAAETLARKIVREFELAGLNRRAIAALSFLTQILASQTASPKNIRDVHEYIVSLRTNPERDFQLNA
ncbi:MAG TPA: hypothetical protein VGF48_05685 [Thermoanaerobaculia bacterium]